MIKSDRIENRKDNLLCTTFTRPLSTNEPKILIIAPHSMCDDTNKQRHCDRRALKEANKLYIISVNAGYNTCLIVSDKLRAEFDYNRKESFTQDWRKEIRSYIENNKDQTIIIFEIHSFPPVGTEFDKGSQIAVLAIDEYYDGAKFLLDYIKNNTDIIIHPTINDTRVNNLMVDTTAYPNIKQHYLLEFNEDASILSSDKSYQTLFKIFIVSLFPKISRKKIFSFIIVLISLLIILVLMQMDSDYYAFQTCRNGRTLGVA